MTGTAPSVFDEGVSLDHLAIDTIRMLAIDAVQQANSGHPGTPMALAPIGFTLWRDYLRYDPTAPDWPNRDRFVLSAGHASMLLYALIHLAGIDEIDDHGDKTGRPAVSLDDIKAFRQLDSRTPGHPEYRKTTGVETTTGPLGQGCGNSVGMAVAARMLAARFNKGGFTLFDHDIYVFAGDGDMMEGVSHEAASLAGHLKLSNLCWVYDNNHITIEGATDLAFSENVGRRFESYGWQVICVDDANDTAAFGRAVETFKSTDDRPTLIVVHSVIGYGSPIQGTSKAHSDAMGADVIRATKRFFGWPEDAQFMVPDAARAVLHDAMAGRGKPLRVQWEADLARYRQAFPDLAFQLDLARRHGLPEGWQADIPVFPADNAGLASRDAGNKVLNTMAPHLPMLTGGAADLAPSTKTLLNSDGAAAFTAAIHDGRNIHFGVREHAMGAIANGMALSGLRPFTGTFLAFADYMRPPIRLAAMMNLPVIFVFTHDSIGVGEDGPTHQPIEQLASLRAIPGLNTIRPGDANEVAVAWRLALQNRDEPTALIFSRQAIPTLDRTRYAAAEGLARGGYILADCAGDLDIILIGTGSELALVVAAHERLGADGVRSRVVSLPSWHLFEQQDEAYRNQVLPKAVGARLAVEQGAPMGWDRYVGPDGGMIMMTGFGASAPLASLQHRFGFTVDNICDVARRLIERRRT